MLKDYSLKIKEKAKFFKERIENFLIDKRYVSGITVIELVLILVIR